MAALTTEAAVLADRIILATRASHGLRLWKLWHIYNRAVLRYLRRAKVATDATEIKYGIGGIEHE